MAYGAVDLGHHRDRRTAGGRRTVRPACASTRSPPAQRKRVDPRSRRKQAGRPRTATRRRGRHLEPRLPPQSPALTDEGWTASCGRGEVDFLASSERERDARVRARELEHQCTVEPDNAKLWLQTGLLLDSLGREKSAVRHYEHALSLGLSHCDTRTALVCLASSYRNVGELSRASETLERARRAYPRDAAVEAFCSLVLLDLGEADRALRTLGLTLLEVAPDGSLSGFESALRSKFRGLSNRHTS